MLTWKVAWEADTASLAHYKATAAAALKIDARLNKLLYQCVPKKVSEAEFWRLFFFRMRLDVPPDKKDTEDEEDEELRETLDELAEEHAEQIEELTMHFEARLLAPARAQLQALGEEQKFELSQSTLGANGKVSAESVDLAKTYRREMQDAQRTLEDLTDRMRAEIASLKREQKEEIEEAKKEARAARTK